MTLCLVDSHLAYDFSYCMWKGLRPSQVKPILIKTALLVYGIAGIFISSNLSRTILWNLGSSYDCFYRKEERVCAFIGDLQEKKKNRYIFLQLLVKGIQSIKIEVKEGISACWVLDMEIKGHGDIPNKAFGRAKKGIILMNKIFHSASSI